VSVRVRLWLIKKNIEAKRTCPPVLWRRFRISGSACCKLFGYVIFDIHEQLRYFICCYRLNIKFFKGKKMAEIILKTDAPEKAANILKDVLEVEASRLKYSLNLAKKRLKRFETKYNVSSKKFINEWSAEDLRGKDLEYVEWAGEYQLFSRLNERLVVLKSIENVAP